MKKYFTLSFVLFCIVSYGQNYGINTTTPEARLDVNGNVKIRTIDPVASASTYKFLVAGPSNEVQQIETNFVFATNTTIAKAKTATLTSLLDISGISNWKQINFGTASENIPINNNSNYNASTCIYTVPSDGIYEINYSVKYGSGIIATLLANKKVGILIKRENTTTELDEKTFDGANLDVDILGVGSGLLSGLLGITISSTNINSVYTLKEGDLLSFVISSGLDVTVLGNSKAEFVIKKISN